MNTPIKRLAAVCAALFITASAHSADYNFGNANEVGVIFGSHAVSGSFTDRLLFNITSPAAFLSGSLQDVPVSFTFGASVFNVLNIDNLKLTLHTSNGALLVDIGSGDDVGGSGILPMGMGYYYQVTGIANGTNGGRYTFSAFAQAVPEPGTWAMLLAGLGLVGLQLRRKSKQDKSITPA